MNNNFRNTIRYFNNIINHYMDSLPEPEILLTALLIVLIVILI